MSDQNRDFAETGSAQDKVDFQRFEHEPLDLAVYVKVPGGSPLAIASKSSVYVRVFCPDIRVVSRIAAVFEPTNKADKGAYSLQDLGSTIVAYRCFKAQSGIVRVGEIIGKNGVPKVFPQSDIDGVAFETESDNPFIDVEMSLAFPGVPGKWCMYYHATSNNKLKKAEWENYISKVTMTVTNKPDVIQYNNDER